MSGKHAAPWPTPGPIGIVDRRGCCRGCSNCYGFAIKCHENRCVCPGWSKP